MPKRIRSLWSHATTPVKVGLFFGTLGGLLALLGWFRDRGDLLGLVIALLVSFAAWGVVSWAIAQAIYEVEKDEGV